MGSYYLSYSTDLQGINIHALQKYTLFRLWACNYGTVSYLSFLKMKTQNK